MSAVTETKAASVAAVSAAEGSATRSERYAAGSDSTNESSWKSTQQKK